VIDAIHILKERPQFGAVIYIAAREMDLGQQNRWIAGGTIVNASYRMTFPGEGVG
jgi:hypothetical protein